MSTAFVCDNPKCGQLTGNTIVDGWLFIKWYGAEPAEVLHFCSWRCLRRYGKRADQ